MVLKTQSSHSPATHPYVLWCWQTWNKTLLNSLQFTIRLWPFRPHKFWLRSAYVMQVNNPFWHYFQQKIQYFLKFYTTKMIGFVVIFKTKYHELLTTIPILQMHHLIRIYMALEYSNIWSRIKKPIWLMVILAYMWIRNEKSNVIYVINFSAFSTRQTKLIVKEDGIPSFSIWKVIDLVGISCVNFILCAVLF